MPSLILFIVYVVILVTQIDTRATCGSTPVFTNFYYYTMAVVIYILVGYVAFMGFFPQGITSSVNAGADVVKKVLPVAAVLSILFYVGHAVYYFMNRDEIQRAQCKYPWVNTFSDITIGLSGGLVLLAVLGIGIFKKQILKQI